MEDYTGAFLERKQDTDALLLLKKHEIASFHLGGIAIECRLKALLFLYHQITGWDQTSKRRKDAMFKQEIKNPSHSLLMAIRHMPDLYDRAKLDNDFLTHLHHIIHPLGATNNNYISLRYIPQSTCSQDDWKRSFDYVCGWLKTNQGIVL